VGENEQEDYQKEKKRDGSVKERTELVEGRVLGLLKTWEESEKKGGGGGPSAKRNLFCSSYSSPMWKGKTQKKDSDRI